jgi:hypothetical protein
LLSATARATVATLFLLTPTVRAQLGDASMAALSAFIATCLCLAIAGHRYVARQRARRDLAADAFAVLAVVPAGLTAAGIQGADDRFGGRTVNVLAALASVTLIVAILALIARMDGRMTFGQATLGSLGGALTLAALVGNPGRFVTTDAWLYLSVAWMVAGAASASFIVLGRRARAVVPILVYAAFTAIVALLPAESSRNTEGLDELSLLTLAVTGAIIVLIAPAGDSR